MSTKISIVVPFKDVPLIYFKAHLESLAAQDCVDCEFIYVDDQSIDSSPNLVKEYVAKDSRFNYIRAQEWGNNGGSRELGYHQACGEYVWFIDADDQLIGSNVLSVVLDILAQQGSPDVLICKEEHHGQPNVAKRVITSTPEYRVLPAHADIIKAYQQGDRDVTANVSPHNKVFKRAFLQENRFSCAKQAVHADIIFVIIIALANHVVLVDDVYYQVIDTPGAIGKSPLGRATGCAQHFRLIEHTHGFYLLHKARFAPISTYVASWTLLRHCIHMRFALSWYIASRAEQRILIKRFYDLLLRLVPEYPKLQASEILLPPNLARQEQAILLQPILDAAYRGENVSPALEKCIRKLLLQTAHIWLNKRQHEYQSNTLRGRIYRLLPASWYVTLKKLLRGAV
jgi:glycosyltransferase involved in cell wall biosynthesis